SFLLLRLRPPLSPPFPYTTLFRSEVQRAADSMNEICSIDIDTQLLRDDERGRVELHHRPLGVVGAITPWNVPIALAAPKIATFQDRKSTRLNSSHVKISYAVFCLK